MSETPRFPPQTTEEEQRMRLIVQQIMQLEVDERNLRWRINSPNQQDINDLNQSSEYFGSYFTAHISNNNQ